MAPTEVLPLATCQPMRELARRHRPTKYVWKFDVIQFKYGDIRKYLSKKGGGGADEGQIYIG